MINKYRVVLTCYEYGKPNEPFADCIADLFDSIDSALSAVSKSAADELATLNNGRTKVPVLDSDGNIVGHDYDFRSDDSLDHETIVRFWDGDDYQDVTCYDIYPVKYKEKSDGTISNDVCHYRGFNITSNSGNGCFYIDLAERDIGLTVMNSFQNALKWVDDFCLLAEIHKSNILTKTGSSEKPSLSSIIENAEIKVAAADPGKGNCPEQASPEH